MRVLRSRQRSALFSLPQREAELLRHDTLTAEDLQNIGARRPPRNKRGFSQQLCGLLYPGRRLASGEFVPQDGVDFIGSQIGLEGDELALKLRQHRDTNSFNVGFGGQLNSARCSGP